MEEKPQVHSVIVRDPIRTDDMLARVGDRRDGAVLLFMGTVRDHHDGRPVAGIRYEAYEEMAEVVLREIAMEATALLGTDRIAVVHRVGVLDVGEVSVAIAASSPHREQAYAASRHVIEEIKRRLPVWKEEAYADGGARWLPGHDPRAEAATLSEEAEPA